MPRKTQLDMVAEFFKANSGREVTTLAVNMATGSLAAHTKISQLRDRGMDIQRTSDRWIDGRRIVGYTYFPFAPVPMPVEPEEKTSEALEGIRPPEIVAAASDGRSNQSSESSRHGEQRDSATGSHTVPIETPGGSLFIFAASALTRLTNTPPNNSLPIKDAEFLTEFLNQSNNNQKKVSV